MTLPAASDLSGQITLYLKKIDRDLEDLGSNPNFEDGVDSFYRDANILVLLAVAAGLSPEESPFKASAAGIAAAGQKCAAVTSLAEAKEAAAALKAAAESASADGAALEWEKAAHLSPLMKKGLPSIITEIKRLGRNEKTLLRSGNLDKVAGDAATLTVIALGCRSLAAETQAPAEETLWFEYCDRLYERSLALHQAADALRAETGSFDAFSAAFKELDATCNTSCHEKFGGSSR